MSYLELENISFEYPNQTLALNQISLSVEKGEKLAVVGENGSGKSSLFLCLCGIHYAQTGRYIVDGEEQRCKRKDRNKLFRKVGYVFQDPEVQLFASTVEKDISFGAINAGMKGKDLEACMDEVMEMTQTHELKKNPPHQLSYGQKKRVAIAGVLACKPEVLLLDEPFAWLDNQQKKNTIQILDELHQQNKTIIISTHDINFVYEWANKLVVMKEGRILAKGHPHELLEDEALLEQAGLEMPLILQLSKKLNLESRPETMEAFLKD
ncbi:energy-coupling factor ABC transporter ATP-binding protein [Ancylomarina sp. DW003]|nr:ABC transporter ATP-binding protein [Ancylomarina sp. DW003]MDE5423937.1 energy-coupling factor ABC transporter ATP-binding protein [Ancylomarina sp. DW003]